MAIPSRRSLTGSVPATTHLLSDLPCRLGTLLRYDSACLLSPIPSRSRAFLLARSPFFGASPSTTAGSGSRRIARRTRQTFGPRSDPSSKRWTSAWPTSCPRSPVIRDAPSSGSTATSASRRTRRPTRHTGAAGSFTTARRRASAPRPLTAGLRASTSISNLAAASSILSSHARRSPPAGSTGDDMPDREDHDSTIVDQFTRQAEPLQTNTFFPALPAFRKS